MSVLFMLYSSEVKEKKNYEVKVKTNLHSNTEQQNVGKCTPKKIGPN